MEKETYRYGITLICMIVFYELGMLELMMSSDTPKMSPRFFYLFVLPGTAIVLLLIRPWLLKKHASDSKTISYKRIAIGVTSFILLFVTLIWLLTLLR